MADLPAQAITSGLDQHTISAPQTSIVSSTVAVASGTPWASPIIERIEPHPIKIHQISDERLEMLATLPRKKWDQFALGGAAASFPSAAESIHSSWGPGISLHLDLFGLLEVIIFIAFSVGVIVQRFRGNYTSEDLLTNIRSPGKSGATTYTKGSAG
jgi:hypothetical protein